MGKMKQWQIEMAENEIEADDTDFQYQQWLNQQVELQQQEELLHIMTNEEWQEYEQYVEEEMLSKYGDNATFKLKMAEWRLNNSN